MKLDGSLSRRKAITIPENLNLFQEISLKALYKPFRVSTKRDVQLRTCNSASKSPRKPELNLVPRVFSASNMAAAREKTLAHSRSRVSNEDGDVFKMAATAKRVRRTGYEMLR